MPAPILGSTRRAEITFFRTGRIDITARIARAIDLQPGDVIDIFQDGSEYYLHVALKACAALGRHQARCHPTKPHSHHYRAWSRTLARAVLSLCGSPRVAPLAAGEPVIIQNYLAIPIITRKVISSKSL